LKRYLVSNRWRSLETSEWSYL